MVEMLGVLAIIGVLSVGSIAGYSKAMMKYKLNKQAQQLGSILDYVLMNSDAFPRGNINSIIRALNIIPKEMIKQNDGHYFYDVFNNQGYIYYSKEQSRDYFGLALSIGEHSQDTCRNLLQLAQLRSKDLWHILFQKDTQNEASSFQNRLYGDNYCAKSRACLKDTTLSEMQEKCSVCDNSIGCRFIFLWGLEDF